MSRVNKWTGILAVFGLMLSVHASAQESSSYATGPAPSWVETAAPSASEGVARKPKTGQSLLLFDQQVNAVEKAHYRHHARKIHNESGMQDGSRINIYFDPTYQKLTIHGIAIRRGSNVLNRLQRDKIKVLQRERDLERNIYDGTLSLVLFLDDVRIGDQIDYSYTIHGFNPTLGERYAGSFATQWSIPVQRHRFRLLWPKQRPLAYVNHGNTAQPTITENGDLKEYVWQASNLPAIIDEDETPSWFDVYPWVQLSDFTSWADVARWAKTLYPPVTELSSELREKIEQWKTLEPEDRVTAALQFVQQEVRYLGFEFGASSHRPADPSTVFERRFGDCKDKSYLFCTILQGLGIKAVPALVHTDYRETIADWAPSPFAFDHVIAQVKIAATNSYVDPTRSYQQGPARTRYLPDYKLCLPIGDDVTGFATIPAPKHGLPLTTITEDFLIRRPGELADLSITTTFMGAAAERVREQFDSTSKEEMEKDYLNYYAKQYSQIRIKAPLRTTENANDNSFTTIESYEITGFWKMSSDRRNHEAEFSPSNIGDLLDKPSTTLRATPVAIAHPQHYIHRTAVTLPEAWPTDKGEQTITSAASILKEKHSCIGSNLVMEYEYRSLTNCVTVRDVPKYLEDLDKMDEALGYSITLPNENAPAGQFNWPIFAVGALFTLLAGAAAVFAYCWKSRGPPPMVIEPSGVGSNLAGLGGWLILVGIGLVIGLLRGARDFWSTFSSYSVESWNSLTIPGSESYHRFWAPYLTWALIANIALLVFSALMIALFFRRRRSFPRLYICYMIFIAVVSIIEVIASKLVSQSEESSIVTLVRVFVACAIWIPYMRASKRVKLTFVH